MPRILIIDDDASHVQTLGHALRKDNHEVHSASSGAMGIEMAASVAPDIVLVEWKLPDVSGARILTELARSAVTRHVPVVFLTSTGAERHRVRGFELGAADYVVKPYSTRELLLRIQAILRRAAAPPRVPDLERGALRVDRAGRRVWVDGREVMLSRLEHDLLTALLDAEERVQTRATLLRSAWGRDTTVTERAVDTHVTRLRNKLGRAAEYVQTVRGSGYRFSCSIVS